MRATSPGSGSRCKASPRTAEFTQRDQRRQLGNRGWGTTVWASRMRLRRFVSHGAVLVVLVVMPSSQLPRTLYQVRPPDVWLSVDEVTRGYFLLSRDQMA
jgi:hypothetical protein